MMKLSQRLTINKSGYYVLRFKIKQNLRYYFKRTAINKSLATKDYQEARVKADTIYFHYKELLKVVNMLTSDQIQELVNKYIVEQLEQDTISRASNGAGLVFANADDGKHFKNNAQASREVLSSFIADYKEELGDNDISSIIPIGSDLLNNINIVYDKDNTSHRLFMMELLKGQLKLFTEVSERYLGNYKEDNSFIPIQQQIAPKEIIITLKEAYNRFDSWYKKIGVTPKQYMATTNKLIKTILPYFNNDTDVKSITLEDIEEFKEFLSVFPNISRLPYKNMNFTEIANLDDIPEYCISGSTQSKYLKILKQFFNFMLDDGVINRDPTKRLIMPDGASNPTEPFTKNDMKTLFNEFENINNNSKYIYYILAYTGMRPSELWKCNIKQEDNIYYFDLTSKDIDLKTVTSRRKIPLHSKLIDMDIPNKFSSLQSDFKQVNISNHFNKQIINNIEDTENKRMYGFRHTVSTNLKHQDVIMDKVSEILGHSYQDDNMTKSTYSKQYTLAQLKDVIENLNY